MIKILCFGDSNTFGYIPASGKRYNSNTRWTGRLAGILGHDYKIIEAGCNNRTCFSKNIDGELQTGYKAIIKPLMQNPDIIIFSLGINDLQRFYNPSESEIKDGICMMIDLIKKNCDSKIIILIPPIITEDVLSGNFSFQFNAESVQKSKLLPKIYKQAANQKNCICLDLNSYVQVSPLDGLHYSADAHSIIADELADCIKKIQ